MPIYEYYCPACDGRFSHLARSFDTAPPPCPGCGASDVERMISQFHTGRSEAGRRADLEARSQEVDGDDPQAAAQFLQEAGDLVDQVAPIEREAFREIVERRAQGAQDEDLQDVVDEIPFPRQRFEGSVPSPYEGQEQGHHHGPGCAHHHHHHHDHGEPDEEPDSEPTRGRDRGGAKDLGWA